VKGLTEKIKRSVIIVSTAWCPELQNNKDNEKNHSANSIALTASTTMLTSPAIVTLPRNSYTSLCKHNVQVNHHSLSSDMFSPMPGHYSLHGILGRLLNINSVMVRDKPNMLRVFQLLGFPIPNFAQTPLILMSAS
jgi:hypothetical protein